MNGYSLNGSAISPSWLPAPPPKGTGPAVESQSFILPRLPRWVQQTRDVQDYDLDFGDVFPWGDSVVNATVSADFAGLNLETHIAAPVVKLWVEGGTPGSVFKVTVVAHTAAGRAYEADFKVRIKDR